MLCAGEPSVPPQPLVTKFKSDETETIEEEKPQKLDGFYLVSLLVKFIVKHTVQSTFLRSYSKSRSSLARAGSNKFISQN